MGILLLLLLNKDRWGRETEKNEYQKEPHPFLPPLKKEKSRPQSETSRRLSEGSLFGTYCLSGRVGRHSSIALCPSVWRGFLIKIQFITRIYKWPSFFNFKVRFFQPRHSFFNFNVRFIQPRHSFFNFNVRFI